MVKGVAGVAPGVSLHAVRVLNGYGSGYYSDIVAGLEYVLENPEIKVVNMSLGGPKSSETEPLKEAIKRLEDAGVVVCTAAGNEAQNTKNVAPAAYNYGVIVSAYDVASSGSSISDRGFAWFSNYGNEVDIAAPEFQSIQHGQRALTLIWMEPLWLPHTSLVQLLHIWQTRMKTGQPLKSENYLSPQVKMITEVKMTSIQSPS